MRFSDETRAKFVKVTEKLGNSCTLLFAEGTDASKHVLNIIRLQLYDVGLDSRCLSFRIVVVRHDVLSVHTKHAFMGIYFFTEIVVVDFISVAFVHVPSQQ